MKKKGTYLPGGKLILNFFCIYNKLKFKKTENWFLKNIFLSNKFCLITVAVEIHFYQNNWQLCEVMKLIKLLYYYRLSIRIGWFVPRQDVGLRISLCIFIIRSDHLGSYAMHQGHKSNDLSSGSSNDEWPQLTLFVLSNNIWQILSFYDDSYW